MESGYVALRERVSSSTKLPAPWSHFLEELDAGLPGPTDVHCLGGFVLTVLHGLPRRTGDIDLLAVLPHDRLDILLQLAGPDSRLARKYGIHIHFVGVAEPPEDYQERLVPIAPGHFQKLRLYALELHNIVLAKLTRNHPVDIEDVKYLAQKGLLKPDVLRGRYERELRPRLSNQKKHELTLALWLSYFAES